MVLLAIYSLIAGVATFAGALVILALRELSRRTVTRLMGFGSGVLVATASLHLIPGSVEMSPLAAGWALLISFLLFMGVEQFVHSRSCLHYGECKVGVIGTMAFVALFIHSLVDGLAIAAGLRASPELGLATAAAVIAHEVPEGITSVSLFRAAGYTGRLTFGLASAVAFATPAGAFAAWHWTAGVTDPVLAMLLAFAAGSFIYVAAADILPRLHEEQDVPAFLYLMLGVMAPVMVLLME